MDKINTIKKVTNPLFVFLVIVVIALWSLVSFWINSSNDLNDKQQTYQAQWSQVENVMQRRADLIPNLTASVKGEMHNEQKIFKSLADARKSYNSAGTAKDKLKADSSITENVSALINIIHEKYPKLESHKQVSKLMIEIEGSENRISTERHRYIQDIQAYNRAVRNFPTSVVAQSKGMYVEEYYKADTMAKKVPKIDLD